jgi:hypothetical protein
MRMRTEAQRSTLTNQASTASGTTNGPSVKNVTTTTIASHHQLRPRTPTGSS